MSDTTQADEIDANPASGRAVEWYESESVDPVETTILLGFQLGALGSRALEELAGLVGIDDLMEALRPDRILDHNAPTVLERPPEDLTPAAAAAWAAIAEDRRRIAAGLTRVVQRIKEDRSA